MRQIIVCIVYNITCLPSLSRFSTSPRFFPESHLHKNLILIISSQDQTKLYQQLRNSSRPVTTALSPSQSVNDKYNNQEKALDKKS
jgi:hypothetical protein